MPDQIKLHIGGVQAKDGWAILNIAAGPDVDIVGSCTDLSMFGDGAVDEVYASHVIEHLSGPDVYKAVGEIARVLKPGGRFVCSVPNVDVLFRQFLDNSGDLEKQVKILSMVYGGHSDAHDIHHFGFNFKIMAGVLAGLGFKHIDVVDVLNEFADTSFHRFDGELISLNFIAIR